jgi:hypothetical protein
VKILQSVVVKQVLTENSKKKLLDQFEKKLFQLKKEVEQLQFERKKLEKTSKLSPQEIQHHFDLEMKKRSDKIKMTTFQMEQLDTLPLGSELKEKEVQAIVDIQIGDNWDEKMNQAEIIIKDGIVQEIR